MLELKSETLVPLADTEEVGLGVGGDARSAAASRFAAGLPRSVADQQ